MRVHPIACSTECASRIGRAANPRGSEMGRLYLLAADPIATDSNGENNNSENGERRAFVWKSRWTTSPPNAQAMEASEGQRTAVDANAGGRGHQATEA